MASAILCSACGAKIKAGRSNCLRCGEPLTGVAASQKAAPDAATRPPTDPRHIGGAVLSLILLLSGVAYVRSAQDSALEAAPSAVPARPVEPPTPQVAKQQEESGRAFMDPDREGHEAYAGNDMPRAIDAYQKAVEKNPDDLTSLNNLGQVLVRSGRAAEAIQYFERATKLNATDWAPRFNLARAYGELGDWKNAIAEYRVASRLMPEDYVTQFNLARALHKTGEEEQAVEAYHRAIALAPGEPSFRLALGISYEHLKKPAEATRAYEEYLELAPDAPDAKAVKNKIDSLKNPPA